METYDCVSLVAAFLDKSSVDRVVSDTGHGHQCDFALTCVFVRTHTVCVGYVFDFTPLVYAYISHALSFIYRSMLDITLLLSKFS